MRRPHRSRRNRPPREWEASKRAADSDLGRLFESVAVTDGESPNGGVARQRFFESDW